MHAHFPLQFDFSLVPIDLTDPEQLVVLPALTISNRGSFRVRDFRRSLLILLVLFTEGEDLALYKNDR
jgi:hypothetical protein